MKIFGRIIPVSFAFALLALTLAGAPAAAASGSCPFGYEGATGPEHWWELCVPANLTCESGTRQSPIDLPTAPDGDLPHLVLGYQPIPLEVKNTGTTIEVEAKGTGNYLRLGQERYELIQFHFHTPSEHKVQGQSYPMELHFVHSNALGELAVVGVLLREGAANPVIQEIWDHIPGGAELSEEHPEIDPQDLLPANRGYYRYAGSLTTPPCSEGVRWHVLHEPVEVSAAQIEEFQAIFPLNARPVQPLHDRKVFTEGF